MREIQIVLLITGIAILSALVRPAMVASFVEIEKQIADDNLQVEIAKAKMWRDQRAANAVGDDASSTY